MPSDLDTLLADAPGQWSWHAVRFSDQKTVSHRAEVEVPSASLIKVPIMMELFRRVEHEHLNLDATVPMRCEDQVGGSGVMGHLTTPREWCLRDLVTLMMIVSDNTATNLLIDLLGVEAVNQTLKSLGVEHTRLLRRLMRIPTDIQGMNHTTARDMTQLMDLLAHGKAISVLASQQMVGIMERCQAEPVIALPAKPGLGLVREPEDRVVAHKTGLLDTLVGDSGIVMWPGEGYAATVIGRGAPHQELAPWHKQIGHAIAEVLVG